MPNNRRRAISLRPVMDKNSVLRLQRHDVGHRPERDEVEPSPQFKARQWRVLSRAWQSLKTIPTLQR